jgi:hypothetical protein
MAIPKLPITVSKFSSDPNLLALQLWDKQKEILEEFWNGDFSVGVWALGRRSGKTLMSAVVATYAACMLADAYKSFLRSGEKFYIVSVANTLDQSKIALQGVKDLINGSPILKPMIVRETSDTLELSNGAIFRAMPASSRGGRGLAVPLLIFDEIGHALDTEGGNAAGSSLYQALSPSVAQFGRLGKILLLSSPWIQQGVFWELFKQGNSGNFPYMQVRQEPSWEMNPTLSPEFLEQERARDPELFAVEYGANFSQSLSTLVSADVVEAAIHYDRGVLPPLAELRGAYYLSLDPAKGNRDKYTACLAHYDDDRLIVDLWHEFKPNWSDGKKSQVNVSEVEDWILQQHSAYGFAEVVLDQYNSAGTIQRLSGQVPIREVTWTAPSKTEAFTKLRELYNAGKIETYPHPQANQQIKNLVVTYRSTGAWSVTGGSGVAVDDFAFALAGVLLIAKRRSKTIYFAISDGDEYSEYERRYQAQRDPWANATLAEVNEWFKS